MCPWRTQKGELPRYDRRQPVLHNQRWAAKPAAPTEPAKVPIDLLLSALTLFGAQVPT